MSWLVASFAIVLGALLVGWLAYERSRPSARMTAIVATLAAVAALGRDAFVALPDVKPITAIALVVGYSLGPLPGFTVGAVGMLASNVMLGQGSYTPWQMAAWGLVGLIGAGLGGLARRRSGGPVVASIASRRLTIALVCALSAMLAKEIMNVYTWTLSGSHTLPAFLTVASLALPFDLTDAVASFAFGFAFGPELARLLTRVRGRMTVVWASAAAPIAAICVIGFGVCLGAAATNARAASASVSSAGVFARTIDYLRFAQNADGGFGAARGQHSSELYSAWAAIGIAAAGQDPLALRRGGHTVLDSIRSEARTLSGPGDLERTILALRACRASTHAFPGGDLLARLLRYRSGDGSFGELANITAFAVFALRATGRSPGDPVVRAAARWLERQQNGDGSFGFARKGVAGDVDDTAAAVQALVDAGARRSGAVARAASYLVRAQDWDGGYGQQPGGPSNAQSTAWAIQGLIAAGRDVGTVRRRGRSPLQYLTALINPNGSVQYTWTNAQTPVWVTGEALVAFAGRTF
ncbi:MAG TPA: prenyltransferase/squalene oxidase repeat-containing protein [Solirubrobacteraceae bacterium]|nr:prenyltransferase/squalene oxidase repeat-containing protein [Solirubrobacteraceae bacterium]